MSLTCIQNKCLELIRAESAAHPELGRAAYRESDNIDDHAENGYGMNGLDGSNDASALGTPAQIGGTKLKLNFGQR